MTEEEEKKRDKEKRKKEDKKKDRKNHEHCLYLNIKIIVIAYGHYERIHYSIPLLLLVGLESTVRNPCDNVTNQTMVVHHPCIPNTPVDGPTRRDDEARS